MSILKRKKAVGLCASLTGSPRSFAHLCVYVLLIFCRSIVSFYKRVKGMKWDNFNTSKVCDLTYANVQGREALVRKFRNSRYERSVYIIKACNTFTCMIV